MFFFILTQELGKRREREKGGKKNQMTFSLSAHGTWEKMEEIAKKEAWPLAGRKMRGEKPHLTQCLCVSVAKAAESRSFNECFLLQGRCPQFSGDICRQA